MASWSGSIFSGAFLSWGLSPQHLAEGQEGSCGPELPWEFLWKVLYFSSCFSLQGEVERLFCRKEQSHTPAVCSEHHPIWKDMVSFMNTASMPLPNHTQSWGLFVAKHKTFSEDDLTCWKSHPYEWKQEGEQWLTGMEGSTWAADAHVLQWDNPCVFFQLWALVLPSACARLGRVYFLLNVFSFAWQQEMLENVSESCQTL